MKQETITNETKKCLYVKPTTTVYELEAESHLLAGSPVDVPISEDEWPDEEPQPW